MQRVTLGRSAFVRIGTIGLATATLAALAGLGVGPARAEEPFTCGAGEISGIPPADAETAVRLVCDAIRRESGVRGQYEVSLGTLGRLVILSVAGREPPRSEAVSLDGLEEIEIAAPRVARALAGGEAFAATQRVDNLLETETRKPPVKRGSVKFCAGIADVETPGFGARATGFSLGLQYATPRFTLPFDLRFGLDDPEAGEPEVDLFTISVGGRYYTSKRDVSPFFGAGLGMVWLHAGEDGYPYSETPDGGYFYADHLGVAPYVEAGVEALRLHRGRIALFVRADLPLSWLESPEIQYQDWNPRTNTPGEWRVIPGESRYVVPVSIGVTVAF